MTVTKLPVPSFYDESKVGEIYVVPYLDRMAQAADWAKQHSIQPSVMDSFRICVMGIDVQNTFCMPDGQLYVGGRSGTGAVDDNRRMIRWLYEHLGYITEIDPTMDTHRALQIFHPPFWVDQQGNHPSPMTVISVAEVESGAWSVNPRIAASVTGGDYMKLQRHALHYVKELDTGGKYPLVIWPFHGMLGGIGHALVPAFEEVCFFHTMTRWAQTGFEIKGGNLLTENYSVLAPEVTTGPDGEPIDQKNSRFISRLLNFDAVFVFGQAQSHCLSWTVADLLTEMGGDADLAKKVYLIEDGTSPVVVPGVVDFTDEANAAFKRFAQAGMHVVKTTDPLDTWPGLKIS